MKSATAITVGGLTLPSLASCSCFSSITKRAGRTRSTGGSGASVERPPCLTIDFDKVFFKMSTTAPTFRVESAFLGALPLGLGESVVYFKGLGL